MNEVDYETPSEFEQVDINSDHEPPSDKLLKKKIFAKEPDYRLYKVILRTGKHFKKPAKFDRIKYKRLDLEEESAEDLITASTPSLECNLGMSKGLLTREEEYCIESMKKEEIALFEIEYLTLSKTGDRKLAKRQHFQIELVEWVTVIDLFQDKTVLKVLHKKGVKRDCFEEHDIADVNWSVWLGKKPEQKISWQFLANQEVKNPKEGPSKLAKEFLKRMKEKEKSEFSMTSEYFFKNEEENQIQRIKNGLSEPIGSSDFLSYEIELVRLQKQTDIFDDGEVLYLTQTPGESTAQVETHSKVELELKITVDGLTIYDSSISGEEFIYEGNKKETSTLDASALKLPPELKEIPSLGNDKPMEESKEEEKTIEREDFPKKVFRFWVNEYSVSKALARCSRRMKQGENCQIRLNGPSHLEYGKDTEAIRAHFKSLEPELFKKHSVIMNIRVVNFETGRNAFNVPLGETKEMLARKREAAVRLIGQQQYKKAMRVLNFSDEWIKTGRRPESEKNELRPMHVSTLLNLSLCQMKRKEWGSVVQTCERIIMEDPKNRKALLRLAKGLLEQQKYKEALEIFEKEEKTLEGNDDIWKEAKELRQAIEKEKGKYETKAKKMCEKMFA